MKHKWFGVEWSSATYLAYNCKGKDNRPEFVFEWYNGNAKRLQHYEGRPIKDLAMFGSWRCGTKAADEVYKAWGKTVPYTDYIIGK